MPMCYYVPKELVELERSNPGSQKKVPSPAGSTDGVFLWGQSLYIIAQLMGELVVFLR